MARARGMRGVLEDVMPRLNIKDFSPGLMSAQSPNNIPPGAASDIKNFRISKGILKPRLGIAAAVSSIGAVPDGIYFFYDSAGTRRLAVFANGNLYDMVGHTATLVAASVYASGNEVTATVLNGVLYFSDGTTITGSTPNRFGIRKYDPQTSTSTAPGVTSSGSSGTIETPACKVLLAHNGALVLGNIKYVDASTAKDAVLWSNVADPTTILGTNIFKVGEGQGGEINCISRFTVSAAGVSPYSALFVGKTEGGVFQLKGALSVSDLAETVLDGSVGVLDGASCRYVGGKDSKGFVIFLATDRQLYGTDGINTAPISDSIRDELEQAIEDRQSESSTARFRSVRDFKTYHYILDTGRDSSDNAVHYAFNYRQGNWTKYVGWTTGYWTEARNNASQEIMYCADDQQRLSIVQGNQDYGSDFEKSWTSGWLHAGDSDLWKYWKWIYLEHKTDNGAISYSITTNQGNGDTATGTLTPDTSSTTATNDLIWGSGTWDDFDWASSGLLQVAGYKTRDRLAVLVDSAVSLYDSLSGYDAQLTLSHTGTNYVEIHEASLLFTDSGRERVA